MWAKPKLRASPAALLLYALLWFFDTDGIFAALLPAAAVHELGHLLALKLRGLRLRSLSLGLFGLELDYYGCPEGREALLPILAGPAAGLLWTAAAACLPGDYWRMACGGGLALNLVNLLPVLPLDGGRAMLALAGERAVRVSRIFSVFIAAFCLFLAFICHSLPPLIFAAGLSCFRSKNCLKNCLFLPLFLRKFSLN